MPRQELPPTHPLFPVNKFLEAARYSNASPNHPSALVDNWPWADFPLRTDIDCVHPDVVHHLQPKASVAVDGIVHYIKNQAMHGRVSLTGRDGSSSILMAIPRAAALAPLDGTRLQVWGTVDQRERDTFHPTSILGIEQPLRAGDVAGFARGEITKISPPAEQTPGVGIMTLRIGEAGTPDSTISILHEEAAFPPESYNGALVGIRVHRIPGEWSNFYLHDQADPNGTAYLAAPPRLQR